MSKERVWLTIAGEVLNLGCFIALLVVFGRLKDIQRYPFATMPFVQGAEAISGLARLSGALHFLTSPDAHRICWEGVMLYYGDLTRSACIAFLSLVFTIALLRLARNPKVTTTSRLSFTFAARIAILLGWLLPVALFLYWTFGSLWKLDTSANATYTFGCSPLSRETDISSFLPFIFIFSFFYLVMVVVAGVGVGKSAKAGGVEEQPLTGGSGRAGGSTATGIGSLAGAPAPSASIGSVDDEGSGVSAKGCCGGRMPDPLRPAGYHLRLIFCFLFDVLSWIPAFVIRLFPSTSLPPPWVGDVNIVVSTLRGPVTFLIFCLSLSLFKVVIKGDDSQQKRRVHTPASGGIGTGRKVLNQSVKGHRIFEPIDSVYTSGSDLD
mmetsp:Transcript_21553/g.55968  ORF Transcript_21553/g.55968 Transcript_21553/m.55968 type:complete len:379 (-) Transcript_21553:69-1205(-)